MSDSKLYFYKGEDETLSKLKKAGEELKDAEGLKKIQDSFSKVLDGKNLSFLLGSGCSSHKTKPTGATVIEEVGIPTMKPLAEKFYAETLSVEYKDWLKDELKVDVTDTSVNDNLEQFLGILHSLYYYYTMTKQIDAGNVDSNSTKLNEVIKKTRDFLLKNCLNEENSVSKDAELQDIYKTFYRKLLYRNSNLPKPNIFTTNYDLYSETALDKLGVHYVNGFTGGIKKYFNPTIFNYALAERMDLSQTKWSVIDNFVYLYKLHGSVNWIQDVEDDSKLFGVREIQDATFEKLEKEQTIMIHPTPLKQNASLGSPYSDLFREFQKKLMQNNNVLVTIGYSFSDEHINNLIYQAFTIPSFRLIVLGTVENKIEQLKSLNDPRIWIIGGELEDESMLHFFKGFAENILPSLSNDEIDRTIENAIRTLLKKDE